jgi:hypothetical protein
MRRPKLFNLVNIRHGDAMFFREQLDWHATFTLFFQVFTELLGFGAGTALLRPGRLSLAACSGSPKKILGEFDDLLELTNILHAHFVTLIRPPLY